MSEFREAEAIMAANGLTWEVVRGDEAKPQPESAGSKEPRDDGTKGLSFRSPARQAPGDEPEPTRLSWGA